MLLQGAILNAQTPSRDFTTQVTTNALFFDGNKLPSSNNPAGWEPNDSKYAYEFGQKLVADGDCITAIDGFIFFAWYAGDKDNRYIRVSRYNPVTEKVKTLQLNWQHTGFRGNKNIGESHNTIAVGISPKDKTLHLLYDMHAYSADTGNNPGFYQNRKGNGTPVGNRYFRYSFSLEDVTAIADNDWTQDKVFEKANNSNFIGNYTHNSLNGINNPDQYEQLTYPKFFLNSNDDLFFQMRVGGNTNGAVRFYKYNSSNKSWGDYTAFNVVDAKNNSAGNAPDYNWGLYGEIKFLNDNIYMGFQRRKGLRDKYQYQDGIFIAKASNSSGTQWETTGGTSVASPVVNADNLKIGDPERQLPSQGRGAQQDDIVMTGPFDYTVTTDGDIHVIARVRDNFNNESGLVHYYKPQGSSWKIELLNSTVKAERIYTSNDKVYIIGLNNSGRLRIDVSNGGENDFSKIYEEGASDVRYRYGTVRIVDGKVYFLGMENDNNTDSKEPLHLSVIDLKIQDSNSTDEEDITGKWYKLKNVFTNRYLTSKESSLATSVPSSGFDKQWRFVKRGDFYNIESRKSFGNGTGVVRGVARTNQIVGTNFDAPNADPDKLWSVKRLFSGAYTMRVRTAKKYIQNNTVNTATLTSFKNTNRSKWILEEVRSNRQSSDQFTAKTESEVESETISVFPNPTVDDFTIALNGVDKGSITITDMKGTVVYKKAIQSKSIDLKSNGRFTTGFYIIEVVDENKRVFRKKLIVK